METTQPIVLRKVIALCFMFILNGLCGFDILPQNCIMHICKFIDRLKSIESTLNCGKSCSCSCVYNVRVPNSPPNWSISIIFKSLLWQWTKMKSLSRIWIKNRNRQYLKEKKNHVNRKVDRPTLIIIQRIFCSFFPLFVFVFSIKLNKVWLTNQMWNDGHINFLRTTYDYFVMERRRPEQKKTHTHTKQKTVYGVVK